MAIFLSFSFLICSGGIYAVVPLRCDQALFSGRRRMRRLGGVRRKWQQQRLCNTKVTRTTGWRLHHYVPRVMGGSRSLENRVLLHPECHNGVHDQRIAVSKPRLR